MLVDKSLAYSGVASHYWGGGRCEKPSPKERRKGRMMKDKNGKGLVKSYRINKKQKKIFLGIKYSFLAFKEAKCNIRDGWILVLDLRD
jgi:hypothetical protein